MNLETETQSIYGVISIILVLVGGMLTSFKYFLSGMASLRSDTDAKMVAFADAQAKARHAHGNSIQAAITKLDMEQSKTSERITNLALDSVRKSELAAIETRILAMLTGVETRFSAMLDKADSSRISQFAHLEAKIDKLLNARV